MGSFDSVNHDMLVARVARVVKDKRVLKLTLAPHASAGVRAYLNSGVMINGVVMETEEGTPQGGPLSPLLSNVMLDDLDRELEKRGHTCTAQARSAVQVQVCPICG